MLFFIDESWQEIKPGTKVGVLAAVQVKAHDFNSLSSEIHQLKVNHLGYRAVNLEIKGNGVLSNYKFGLEKKGIISNELNLTRAIFKYLQILGVKCFASVVSDGKECLLTCSDENNLERPFFFLFERINLFMEENYPGLMAKLIFDDRGVTDNARISKAVSNFLHKSHIGQTFERIIKVPTFSISTSNVGLQIADLVAYILGKRCVDVQKVREFYSLVKKLEFKSRKKFIADNKEYPLFGFKDIKERNKKEAGDLFDPGRI